MLNKKALLVTAVGFSIMPLSAVQAENVVWGAYVVDTELSANGGSVDGDGFIAGVKAEVNENIFVVAEYDSQTYDSSPEIGIDTVSAGVGAKTAISDSAQAYAAISYENIDLSLGGASADESGFGLRAGVSTVVAPQFWAGAELYFVDVGEADGLFYSGRVGYDFNEQIGGYAELRFGEYDFDDGDDFDRDDIRIGLYYRF